MTSGIGKWLAMPQPESSTFSWKKRARQSATEHLRIGLSRRKRDLQNHAGISAKTGCTAGTSTATRLQSLPALEGESFTSINPVQSAGRTSLLCGQHESAFIIEHSRTAKAT